MTTVALLNQVGNTEEIQRNVSSQEMSVGAQDMTQRLVLQSKRLEILQKEDYGRFRNLTNQDIVISHLKGNQEAH